MGQIAEDILDGNCCAICGCYFHDDENPELLISHDIPVACEECYDDTCGYRKADFPTI